MSEPTKGSWTLFGPCVSNNPYEAGDYAIMCDGQIIGEFFRQTSADKFQDAEGNARLAVAAPDLLAACEAMLTCYEPPTFAEAEIWDRARAAVAKAKGATNG